MHLFLKQSNSSNIYSYIFKEKSSIIFGFHSPSLTWRDIMHITVMGSRPDAIPSNTITVRNAAGFNGKNSLYL